MFTSILIKIVIYALPILFSIIIHEVSHGWIAYKLGDDTAKRMGRLTLNPIPHIDILGTIIVPLILVVTGGPIFGWAKPVIYNPDNFYESVDIRNGTMWVGLAGPLSNLILALISSFIFFFVNKFFHHPSSVIYLLIFQFLNALIVINIVLACFNLIPIPPLDGSKVLMRFLPADYVPYYLMLERFGLIIIFILLATVGLSNIIGAPINYLYKLFLHIPIFIFG